MKFAAFCLLPVVFFARASAQDPMRQPPDTLRKQMVLGSFVWVQGSTYAELVLKRNNTCSWTRKSYGKKEKQKGLWEVNNDTLYVRMTKPDFTDKLVMHDGKLFLLPRGKALAKPGMTKKDYKYYQKQCKKTGN